MEELLNQLKLIQADNQSLKQSIAQIQAENQQLNAEAQGSKLLAEENRRLKQLI